MSQEEAEQDLKDSKIQRRNAKGRFTRSMKSVGLVLNNGRPQEEIEEAFKAVSDALVNVQEKHETLVSKISQDDEYEKEEEWLSQIEEDFMRMKIKKDEYILEMKKAKTDTKGPDEQPVQAEAIMMGAVVTESTNHEQNSQLNEETGAGGLRAVSHSRVFKI